MRLQAVRGVALATAMIVAAVGLERPGRSADSPSGTSPPPAPASQPQASQPASQPEPWFAPPEAAKQVNPTPASPASVAAGKKLFDQQCMVCHGITGKGDGPAAVGLKVKVGDLRDPKLAKRTDGELFWKITNGRPPMASYKFLPEAQRWDIVNYVRTFAPKPK